jgi:hypothetical protein
MLLTLPKIVKFLIILPLRFSNAQICFENASFRFWASSMGKGEDEVILRTSAAFFLVVLAAGGATAADIQGVLADWNCVRPMVKEGRERVLKNDHNCSMMTNYSREAYGIITTDKRFYKLDDAGRAWALKLLKDTPDKDNLKVVVTGHVDGTLIHVKNMSEL